MATDTTTPAAVVWLMGADHAALESLRPAAELLGSFGVRTEAVLWTMPLPASGIYAIIAASPDAALPSALAATGLPVIRVPTPTAGWEGLALLLDDNENLPAGDGDGVFATMAIGEAGAKNAALFIVSILALQDPRVHQAYADFRARQTQAVLDHPPLSPEA